MIIELAFTVTQYAVGCGARPDYPTKSGVMPQAEVTVAVDPDVIPLGHRIHVDGFGGRIAHDTGRLIRGRHIDLYTTDCGLARSWGKRVVTVRYEAPYRRIIDRRAQAVVQSVQRPEKGRSGVMRPVDIDNKKVHLPNASTHVTYRMMEQGSLANRYIVRATRRRKEEV